MKRIVAEQKSHELNADGFLQIVRKYSSVEDLTPDILHEFIDKIVVQKCEVTLRYVALRENLFDIFLRS